MPTRLLSSWVLLALPAFAQVVPPRSFFELSSSNGYGAVLVDGTRNRITQFRERLPATEEPELDATGMERWVGNQPQNVHARDVLFDAYFGLRAGGQQRWLDGAVDSSGWAPGSGVIEVRQRVYGLELTTSVFAPRGLTRASFVAVLCARNAGASAITGVSVFALQNLHLGFGRPGVRADLAANGETLVVAPSGDVFERGFAGVVGTRPLGTATATAWNQASPMSDNGFFVVRDTTGNFTARSGELGVATDWVSGLQFELGTVPAGGERCAGLVSVHHGDPFAQPELSAVLDGFVNGRGAREVLDAELSNWSALQASLRVPNGLSSDEQAVWRQSAVLLMMAQVTEREAYLREWLTQDGEARRTRFRTLDGGSTLPGTIRHRGAGAVLASLPPGEWTYAWVRDGTYAAVALAELGLVDESREALRFFLDSESGRFQNWNELQPAGILPYGVSLTRHLGFGVEETDFNAFGPNLEFDGFGLVLWALREHERRTADTTLVDARWNEIATRVADPLVGLIDPVTGLLRKDSSIWETHWNGRERTWTYSNLTAVRGLCDASELAQRRGDVTRAATYRQAALSLRRNVAQKLTDGAGALASNREELLAGRDYFDAAVLEGIAMGLFAPDGRIAGATLDALDRELKVPFGPGWARNDDRVDHPGATDLSPWGSEYDSAEWVVTDLRGAIAMRAAGRTTRAASLLDFTTRQSMANAGAMAETYEETTGAWKFNAPMIGFGAGAWVLAVAHRTGRALEPACGAFEDEGALDGGMMTTDAGIDAGTDAGQPPGDAGGPDAGTRDAGGMTSDAGTGGPNERPTGCGCSSGSSAIAALLGGLLLRRRRDGTIDDDDGDAPPADHVSTEAFTNRVQPVSTSPHTELDHALPLNLTRLRRGATLSWTDASGAHQLPLEGALVIGSVEGVKVLLKDPKVSRLHAELELDDRGISLRDLGSSNGTWVDDLRVDRVHFERDGHFRVGNTQLELRFADQPARVPLWPDARLGSMLGRSEPMRELFMQLTRIATTDASVLIKGETGTGKELVARELHAASKRASGPFVVVDCASLPETLLEAELFGHTRGAFTGAVTAREGSIEAAEGGTVFLDEIGEVPLAMQPKLLRVLESKTVRRVGETQQRPVNVRFVAATHRDLEAMVAQGQFREDLFFRLAVLPLEVPPLRARPGDLELLLTHFLPPGITLDEPILASLRAQRWVGNVRELKSFAERVSALGLAHALGMLKGTSAAPAPAPAPAHANPLEVDVGMPFKDLRERWTEHLEREYLAALIAKHGRNAGTLADLAGLDRSYVNRLIKKHSL